MGASWEHFGHILGHVGVDFGAWKASLTRFAEILKNHEKRCKVLQKSRFGRSEKHEKITLEGKLRPNSTPSWLIRAQVGAKRGKLTPTWGLTGTKLELKEALGAPKEAPREPKRGTRNIDAAATGLQGGYIFGRVARPK